MRLRTNLLVGAVIVFVGLLAGCSATSSERVAPVATDLQTSPAAAGEDSGSLPAGLASCDAMADEATAVLGQLSTTFGTPVGDFGSGGCSYVIGIDDDPSVVNVKVFAMPGDAHSEAWEGYERLWGSQPTPSGVDQALLVGRNGAFVDVLMRQGRIELVMEASGIDLASIVAIGEALLLDGDDDTPAATVASSPDDAASGVPMDCQADAAELVAAARPDFAAVESVACRGEFALVAWSTSSPRVRVSAVRFSGDQAVLGTWGGFEVNEGADPYDVAALVAVGLPADVAAELYDAIGFVQV